MFVLGHFVRPNVTGDKLTISAGLRCPVCDMPCAAVIQFRSSPVASAHNSYQTWNTGPGTIGENCLIEEFWPEPPRPVVPERMPSEVESAYRQGEISFALPGMIEAAASMYGRALDIGLKIIEKELEGEQPGTLAKRIKRLADKHLLPPKIAEWANALRALRNEALHEIDGLTEDDLKAVRSITDTVMRYLFTLPKMIDALREDTKAAEATEEQPAHAATSG